MAVRKLTKSSLNDLKPTDAAYVVYDTDVKGFGLRIAPSGVRTWLVEYRPYPGGRSVAKKRLSLGNANTLTPDEARRAARDVLSAAAKGEDPAGSRSAKRREMDVEGLVELYAEEGCRILRGLHKGDPMKPMTKAYTLARLRNHVVPLLGPKKVTDVSSTDIERMVRDIEKGKTARDEKAGPRKRIIVRGGEGAARKVARDLSAVFTFAQRRKLVVINPCEAAGIRKTDNQRDRFLTLEEVQRFGQALDEVAAEGANPAALTICRLLALTGCRRNEIAGLKWSEVNYDKGMLEFADTKTRASRRPLAEPAMDLLRTIPRQKGSPFVFPATSGNSHYQGIADVWATVIEKAQLPGITPHTLRHTLGSAAASGGESLLLVGAILGHANARSTQIYAHVQQDPARLAVSRSVAPISRALKGKAKEAKPEEGESR